MPALPRKIMKLFGSSAGGTEIGVFGSLAAASPDYSNDPDEIQSLSNWLAGWYAAVVGNNSPAIQDWNAVFYVMAYQLCYYFERGVAAWNSQTTYYIGSQATDAAGEIYASIADDNLNNPLTDETKWRKLTIGAGTQTFYADGTWQAPFGVTKVTAEVVVDLPSQVGAGNNTAVAVRSDGVPMGIGYGDDGELASAPLAVSVSSPILWGGLGWGARQIVSGGEHVLILSYQGQAYGSGLNFKGCIGGGAASGSYSSPVLVLGAASSGLWRQLAAGGVHSAGIDTQGDCYCWGNNSKGELGTNDNVARSSPVLVVGGLKFQKVGCGDNHTLGLTSSGQVYSWGENDYGQLGDGTTVGKSSPVLVLGSEIFADVFAGQGNSSYAVTPDGRLFAWGDNANGELGDGTTVDKSSPVLVLGGKTWLAVAPGASHVIAIDSARDAYGWGANSDGGIGDNTTVPKSSPVLVVGGLKFQDAAAGGVNFSLGITPDGSLYAWGNNSSGQLGQNSVTKRSSPVLVVGSYTWGTGVRQAVAATMDFTVVPGTSYDVTVNGIYAAFNSVYIWKNSSTKTFIRLKYAG